MQLDGYAPLAVALLQGGGIVWVALELRILRHELGRLVLDVRDVKQGVDALRREPDRLGRFTGG